MAAWKSYWRSLAGIAAAAALYCGLLAPWIAPQISTEGSSVWRIPPPEPTEAWWDVCFDPDAWQRRAPKVLQTERGTLLFEQMEQLDERRWRLTPLTLIVPGDSTRNQLTGGTATLPAHSPDTLLIDAPQGALLEFRDAIDWTHGTTPPLVRGNFLGQIDIRNIVATSDAADGLRITTRDVRLDRRRISTPAAVEMQMGGSLIRGRDLQVTLNRDLLGGQPAPTLESGPFPGLDQLELIYVDEVSISLPDGGLWPSPTATADALPPSRLAAPVTQPGALHAAAAGNRLSPPATPLAKAWLKVACQGAFHFDFASLLATLKEDVRIEHRLEGGVIDRLSCQTLRLHLERQTVAETVLVDAMPRKSAGSWGVRRLEALGLEGGESQDPRRWVELAAPGLEAAGKGRYFDIHLDKGLFAISNRLPGGQPNTAPIYLQHRGHQIWAPELVYRRPPEPSPGGPQRLGDLAAAGPGRGHFSDALGSEPYRISWAGKLSLQPEGPLERLSIEGNATVLDPQQGRFRAEKLSVWLRPGVDGQLPVAASGAVARLIPERLQASGRVSIELPQLQADVEQMQLWFRQLPHSAPPASGWSFGRQALATTGERSPVEVSASPRAVVGPPTDRSATSTPAASPAIPSLIGALPNPLPPMATDQRSVAMTTPLRVTGRLLQARVAQSPSDYRLESLLVDDRVTITRDRVSDHVPDPLTITGNQLLIQQTERGDSQARVVGVPARLQIGRGLLEGPQIHFSHGDAAVWIDEPGRLVVPPSWMAKSGADTAAGGRSGGGTSAGASGAEPESPWLDPLEISWQERMLFDGQRMRATGAIRLAGRLQTEPDTVWTIRGSARSLEARLDAPLNLGPMGGGLPSAQLRSVALREDVDLRGAQTDPSGNRRSIEHLVLPQLEFDLASGQLLGDGPGWWRSRRRSSGGDSLSLSGGGSAPLECLHLTFMGQMVGQMSERQLRFEESVELLTGGIQDWSQELDVRRMRGLELNQTLLTADVLTVQETADLPRFTSTPWATPPRSGSSRPDGSWEAMADGQVVVESRQSSGRLQVTGQRAAYLHRSKTLALQGLRHQPALVRHWSGEGGTSSPTDLSVLSIRINLKTMELFDTQLHDLRMGPVGISRAAGDAATDQREVMAGQQPPLSSPRIVPGAGR